MKLIKRVFYVIFVVVLLAILIPVGLMIFVNPNQFKPQIEKEVQSALHQPFQIKGDLKWTFYPMAGIEAKEVTVGQDLLSVKSIDFSVAVAPLFHKEIRVGKIYVDGLNLHLVKNAKGQANWDIIPSSDVSPSSKKSSSSKVSNASKIAAFSVSQINIKNSQISFDDATQDKHIMLSNFNFSSSDVSLTQAFPVSIKMTVTSNTLASPVKITWSSDLAYLKAIKEIRLTDTHATLNNDLTMTGSETLTLANPLRWKININLNNINIQNLLKLFKKNSLNISGMGTVSANLSSAGSTSTLNGNLTFAVSDGIFYGIDLYYYSDLADSIVNKQPPKSSNTKQTPFGTLMGTAQIQNGVVSNNDLVIKASKMDVSGQGAANLNTQQLDYRLSLQRLTSGSVIKPRGPAIPLTVTGNFAKPSINLDVQSLAVSQAKQVIEDKIKDYAPQLGEKIQQGLASILGK